MRRLALLAVGVLVAAGGWSCSDGEQANIGLNEPIQVAGGQFISGALPGTVPPDGGGLITADGGAPPVGKLDVTSVTFNNAFIVSGLTGSAVSGLVTSDAIAVGIQLAGQGSGYWVVPVQGQDVMFPGQSDFGFGMSLNHSDTPGNTNLRVVGIGKDGSAGQQANGPICILSRVPDNEHACFPKHKVPAAVFSLRWDTNFDLDLHVVTPAGRDVNPKTAVTSVAYDGGTTPPATVGLIDRDSIANCNVDGWRQEDLVFQDPPPKGAYTVYVNPFSSCGQNIAHFVFSLYEAGADGEQHVTFTTSGELLANDTNGGTGTGLKIVQKVY